MTTGVGAGSGVETLGVTTTGATSTLEGSGVAALDGVGESVSILISRCCCARLALRAARSAGSRVRSVGTSSSLTLSLMPFDLGNSGSLLVVVVLLLSSNSLDRLVTPLLFIFVVLSDPKLILTLVFVEKDFALVEVNPLVITGDGDLICLDGKVNIDSNAMYRQKDLESMRDESQEDAREIEASEWDLNYVSLDGNIGCMVNGAGLAMATMDMVKLSGGEPANFLDVGGGATAERVTAAFKIILSDSNVKGILVNIFGGIVRCDLIAQGVLQAVQEVNVGVPIVVRLEGTNAEKGAALLNESDLDVIAANDLGDAARKIVAAVGGEA